MQEYQRTFVELAMSRTALRFGSFKLLKSGRDSPYFFNAGLFNDGEAIAVLGQCYAAALARSQLGFDMLFGPAYKRNSARHYHGRRAGRASSPQRALGVQPQGSQGPRRRRQHRRRAAQGRVVIVDDVITAGTAIRESVDIIRAAGATPVGVALALDRQERGQGPQSAVAGGVGAVRLRCVSILTLAELIETWCRAQ